MPTQQSITAEREHPHSADSYLHNTAPISGAGIGLRAPHAEELIIGHPEINWLEVLADNYFCDGGAVHRQLEAIREHYPITLHSVGMSIGSTEPLDTTYLSHIKKLARRYAPEWISDHLCFTGAHGIQSHDLLPLPFTEEAVRHTAMRIRQIQDFLGQPIMIENISTYLRYRHSVMNESEFITAIAEEADCFILLDLNNVYVNQVNHNENAKNFITNIPQQRVKQLHLGGHQTRKNFLLDAHDHPVAEPVWELFAEFVRDKPQIPTLIEWDNDIPPLKVLLEQASQAQRILDGVSLAR